jgi:hypothetical protein
MIDVIKILLNRLQSWQEFCSDRPFGTRDKFGTLIVLGHAGDLSMRNPCGGGRTSDPGNIVPRQVHERGADGSRQRGVLAKNRLYRARQAEFSRLAGRCRFHYPCRERPVRDRAGRGIPLANRARSVSE